MICWAKPVMRYPNKLLHPTTQHVSPPWRLCSRDLYPKAAKSTLQKRLGATLTLVVSHASSTPSYTILTVSLTEVAYDNVTSPSIQQGDCDITGQGPSYNLALTNIASRDLDPESLDVELWRNGTTPVVTVFFNGAGNDNPALVDPEYHLTCLRAVPSTEVQDSATLVSRQVGMSLVVLSVLGAIMLF